MSKEIKIGLTGGIGSGKSTVADFLRKKGIPVFDADQLAKELMNNNETLRKDLIRNFGEKAFVNGVLNKPFIARLIFNNPKNIEKINSLVHPLVKSELTEKINEALITHNIVAVEAALIFEAEMTDMFDYVWTVTADKELRIDRVMKRSNLSREEIETRMNNQIPEKEKIAQSDFVFYNNDSVEKMLENVSFVLELIKKI